ncbi:MAG: hypothetical protein IPJ65_42500 [Archangiaceae bacterium]|nr:hypothetical protein [Archangiaceae bacterium]
MLILCAVLASAPVAPVKVAVPGLVAVGVDQGLASALTEKLVVLAKRPELSIVTARDIAAVLGVERQKQLLGCDTSGCMAELADALGADVLLRGDLVKAGTSFTLVVKVVRALDGRELVSDTTRVGSEDALQEWIEKNAARLGQEIVERVRGRPATGGPPWLRFAMLGGAAAAAISGGALLGAAYGTRGSLRASHDASQIDALASAGRTQELLGFVLLGAGGALAVATAALFALYDPGTHGSVSVALVPQGAAVAFTWGWP